MISPVRDLTRYFRTLTSASRLRIVEQLARAQGELSVGELAARLNMSQPLVSWHLRDLRRLELVRIRRMGRQAFCSLNRERLRHYHELFSQLLSQTAADGPAHTPPLARASTVVHRHTHLKEQT